MSNDSWETGTRSASGGPARRNDELFCIHSYAGEAGPPCGWRGPVGDALVDAVGGARRCPHCGRATLLEIPPAP